MIIRYLYWSIVICFSFHLSGRAFLRINFLEAQLPETLPVHWFNLIGHCAAQFYSSAEPKMVLELKIVDVVAIILLNVNKLLSSDVLICAIS